MNLTALEEKYYKKQLAEVFERLNNSGADLSKIILVRADQKEVDFDEE